MVADAAAVLLQHPDTIFLALVHVLDSEPSVEGFQVEVGESLVRAVVLRTHEAVELTVIHIRQPLLKLRRLLRKPLHEPVSYLVYLGVGELYALAVAHLDVASVLVLADALGHVRHGVHEGVFQQGDTVVAAVIPLDTELVENLGIFHAAFDGIIVHALRETDTYFRVEQIRCVCRVDTRRNPPLAEVEIQLVERDRARRGLLQGGEGFLFALAVRVPGHPCLDALRLVHYVARDEAVFDLVTAGKRIVEDAPFQLVDQLLAAIIRERFHVVEVHAAVAVERGRESLFGRIDVRNPVKRERYGVVEDVGLDELPVLCPFEGEDVAPRRVHHQELDVRFGVQIPVTGDELVVTGVQRLALRRPFIVILGLVGIEPLVSVAHGNIGRDFLPLFLSQIERVERRPVAGNVSQITDLVTCPDGVYLDERSLTVVRFQQSVERAGFHLLLVSALPLFRREPRFIFTDLPLDVSDTAVHICPGSVFDGIGGTRCGFGGGMRCLFRLDGCRRCLCRCIEQGRLTRLRQLGTVAPAAGLAARLGNASFLCREAEQVIEAHDRRLDFRFLLFGRYGSPFCFLLNCGGRRLHRLLDDGRFLEIGCLWRSFLPQPLLFLFRPRPECGQIFRRRLRAQGCVGRLGFRLLLLQPCIPYAAGVEPHNQPCVQIVVEQLAQLRGDTFYTSVVLIDHCGLAVGVGI